MSKNFIKKLATLLLLAGPASTAFADVIIKGKANEKIQFYSGTTKIGELDTTGTLTLPAGKTLANVGGATPPGMVPVGGMVAVMPNTHANAWQPPATGIIKDGFMRANGHVITAQNVTDGSTFPVGTTLPNMEGAFAKGASSSNTATAAQKLVLANIPQISTSYTPAGTNAASSVSGSIAAEGGHSHSWGGWWSNDNATSVTSGNGDGAQNTYSDGIAGINEWGAGSYAARQTGSHVHHLSNATVQSYAFTPGSGTSYAPVQGTLATVDNWGNTSSATSEYYLPSHRHWIKARTSGAGSSHSHGFSLTSSAQAFTGTQATITVGTAAGSQTLPPDPQNVTVVWVIRVK